jgi:tRNA 2-thiouridine synthesizing protein A
MIEIDARGYHCPVPTLRLQKAMASAAPGDQARLLADDPMAKVDVPHWCGQTGHELVAFEATETGSVFIVRKLA